MGVSGQRHALAALLPPGKGPPVPIVQEAGWAPEPVWTQRLEEKSFASAGDRTPVVQPVANPAPGCQFKQQLFPWTASTRRSFITVKCGVLFEVRTEFLNVIYS
jgi:hypothetical protein